MASSFIGFICPQTPPLLPEIFLSQRPEDRLKKIGIVNWSIPDRKKLHSYFSNMEAYHMQKERHWILIRNIIYILTHIGNAGTAAAAIVAAVFITVFWIPILVTCLAIGTTVLGMVDSFLHLEEHCHIETIAILAWRKLRVRCLDPNVDLYEVLDEMEDLLNERCNIQQGTSAKSQSQLIEKKQSDDLVNRLNQLDVSFNVASLGEDQQAKKDKEDADAYAMTLLAKRKMKLLTAFANGVTLQQELTAKGFVEFSEKAALAEQLKEAYTEMALKFQVAEECERVLELATLIGRLVVQGKSAGGGAAGPSFSVPRRARAQGAE